MSNENKICVCINLQILTTAIDTQQFVQIYLRYNKEFHKMFFDLKMYKYNFIYFY